MPKEILLIFIKNPELGKVKTRLAATIGPERALGIYRLLLKRTREITAPLTISKAIYYAETVVEQDEWPAADFSKHPQAAGGLGTRMQEAFRDSFKAGYDRVGIIGSDCYELTTEILVQAFGQLARQDVVVGPSTDGGYYFLGLKRHIPELFQNQRWSTASVLPDTLATAERLGLKVYLLPPLTDIDEEKDLVTIPGYSRTTGLIN